MVLSPVRKRRAAEPGRRNSAGPRMGPDHARPGFFRRNGQAWRTHPAAAVREARLSGSLKMGEPPACAGRLVRSENDPAGLTPRAGAESGVENRRPDSRSGEKGGADVRPSGGADRFARWREPAVPGPAPSARWSNPRAAGAADGKESPVETPGPGRGPPPESSGPPPAHAATTTAWALGPYDGAAPGPGKWETSGRSPRAGPEGSTTRVAPAGRGRRRRCPGRYRRACCDGSGFRQLRRTGSRAA